MFAGSLSRFAVTTVFASSALLAGAGATGCATATTPSVSVADESTPTIRPVRARAGARHDGEAKLIVDDAILAKCPNVQSTVAQPFSGPATEAWLAILGSVATCLNTGNLANDGVKVQTVGSTHSSDAARVVLTRFGVDDARVSAVSTFDEGACVLDHSCPLTTVKLTLAPAQNSTSSTNETAAADGESR